MDGIEINGKKVKQLEKHGTHVAFHTEKQQVFIIGSKGIPASYGGFETFVEKLTEYQKSNHIRYHVARLADDDLRYEYNGAKCFDVKIPNIGSAKAICHDIWALHLCINYCRKRPSIRHPVFYILACRIGPFIRYYKKQIKDLGGVVYVNPDGHEWKRMKWNLFIRKYWKLSEKLMVKHADLLVCDSKNIEKYIQRIYSKYEPKTKFIAYGSDTQHSILAKNDDMLTQWCVEKRLQPHAYYLVVGRFVPENNYETMIREFMKSKTKKDFVLVTNVGGKYLKRLKAKTSFDRDPRIKFVGTVYNQELLKKIRENAYGYLHGHEVGGTNPSLLEALASTDLNLLLNVGFNREVGENAALYWTKDDGNLAALIQKADAMKPEEITALGVMAKNRISEEYSWDRIVAQYESLFLK